ncbi:MAG: dockerin type I domain-containing protein, partial [Candidatus Sumerlaeota bacterium]|nr:dockerin type I domain-containing protein [Candidatus Sumerlaeota bacterium]
MMKCWRYALFALVAAVIGATAHAQVSQLGDAPPVKNSPADPVNIAPADGAVDVTITPMLRSSAFSDTDTSVTHAASQWQVRAATSPGDWSVTVYDSATDTFNRTSLLLDTGVLSYDTVYYWRVRHENSDNLWSAWSLPTSFKTVTATTGNWTWMKEPASGYGIYGTLGTPATDNTPGGRTYVDTWMDGAGALWLFGGYVKYGYYGYVYNDLWKFDPATRQWTWMKGANTYNQSGTYGTRGTPAAANTPGARYGAVSWRDTSGNLWLFGGHGYDAWGTDGELNDLWKYEPATGNWTWMKGANTINQIGTYGTLGSPAAANAPGGRDGAVSWTDGSGSLWLFGGYGYDAWGNFSYLNDLWKYTSATGNWTWMKGADTINQSGSYGTLGTPGAANTPGSRRYGGSWADGSGALWLFGGLGYGATGSGNLNDLWKYDPATGNWTWMKGSDAPDVGTYGTLGTPAAGNTPGGRTNVTSWPDGSGILWLFGGWDNYGILNDLWKYDLTTGNWTWMKGSNTVNASGTYGSLGTPDPANTPRALEGAAGWTDGSGVLWLFGGGWTDSYNSYFFNDLWRFEVMHAVSFQTDGTAGATLGGTTPQAVNHAANCTAVTANAPAGWIFVKWTQGAVDYSTANPLTVTNVSESMTLTAFFALHPNVPPNSPTNTSPSDGATDVSLMPTLQSSAFSDPDTSDTHAASQWQVRASTSPGDWSVTVYDSTTDTLNRTSLTPGAGVLNYNKTYIWRVRHLDNHGAWSAWSAPTSFTTVLPPPPPAYPLTMNSFNPNSGVAITVTPLDNNSLGDGTTTFTRLYDQNTTVTLTAPATAGANSFKEWDLNGSLYFSGPTINYTVVSTATLTAVYETPAVTTYTLTVASINPAGGVSISVSPADNVGQANGNTLFTRVYNDGTTVTLTAPATVGTNTFLRWDKDGSLFSMAASVNVAITANMTMTAVFAIAANTAPNSPTNIIPSNGATSTSLTPMLQSSAFSDPDAGDTHAASQWQARASTSPGDWSITVYDSTTDTMHLTSVTLGAGVLNYNTTYIWRVRHQDNHGAWSAWSAPTSFTTILPPPPVYPLTMNSINPDSGVAITVTPLDNDGLGNGMTTFTRLYNRNTTVTLTAAAVAGANSFKEWDLDGSLYFSGPTINYTVVSTATLTAVYETPAVTTYTLTVASINPASGVIIAISPNDNSGNGAGPTPASRVYNHGTTVTLTAPAMTGTNTFLRWDKDGSLFSMAASVNVAITANMTMTAVFAIAANTAPTSPTNIIPSNGAAGTSLTPTLQSSAFSDLDAGDAHAASQWQVRASSSPGDWSMMVYDSTTDTMHLTSVTLGAGVLNYNTTYLWRARYQDNHVAWSAWSTPTSFTTVLAPPTPSPTLAPTPSLTPTPTPTPTPTRHPTPSPTPLPPYAPQNILPADNASSVSPQVLLQVSAFRDPNPLDTHAASQWQIRLTTSPLTYSSPAFDSGERSDALTSITLSAGYLGYKTSYHWRARHKDNTGLWSGWSAETRFITEDSGTPFAPDRPVNLSPAAGLLDVALTPTLLASVFRDANVGDILAATHWQIRAGLDPADYSSPSYDTGEMPGAQTSRAIAGGYLNYETLYYWRVCYMDQTGLWSAWSEETSFKTVAAPVSNRTPSRPVNKDPKDGQAGVSVTPLLMVEDFSDPDTGDYMTAMQWRIRRDTSPDYANPAYDSGVVQTNQTVHQVPPARLSDHTIYYWQARWCDSRGAWSEWSLETWLKTRDAGSLESPSGLRAAAGAKSVWLTWMLHTNKQVKGYRLYRATALAGSYQVVNSDLICNTEYMDKNLTPGTTYYYRLAAVTASGVESEWTAAVAALTGATRVFMTSARGFAGTSVTQRVTIDNPNDVSGQTFSMEVFYDPAMMYPLAVRPTALTEAFGIIWNEAPNSGVVRAGGLGNDVQITGEGNVLEIDYMIRSTAVDWSQSICRFGEVILDYLLTPTQLQHLEIDNTATASLTVAKPILWGDVDGNGKVQITDAAVLRMIVLGTLTPTTEQIEAGDMNGDRLLDSADVVLLMRYAIRGRVSDPARLALKAADQPAAYRVSWGAQTDLAPGRSTVPLRIDHLAGVSGMDLAFNFDDARLRLESIAPGGACDFRGLNWSVTSGQARLVFDNRASVDTDFSGDLAVLTFQSIGGDWTQTPLMPAKLKCAGDDGVNLARSHSVTMDE